MSRPQRRTYVRLTVPLLAGAAALALAAPSYADWREPVAGASPINQVAAKDATNTDLTTVGGVPYVVWNEDTTEGSAGSSSTIRVARLSADGQAWDKVANAGTHPISMLGSTSSEHPSIADVGGTPWVAWDEGYTADNSEIRVARLDDAGTAWVRTPDTLRPVNHLRTDPGGMAQYPTIVGDSTGSRPYVSFYEADPGSGSLFFNGSEPAKIWVMRLSADGTTWEEVGGGPVNPLPDFDAAFPRMTVVDGVPWVTYFQVELVGGSPTIGVRVSRLGAGGTWEQVGDPVLSGGPGAVDDPDIASVGGRPYVAAPATMGDPQARIHVFGLDDAGTGWTDLGAASPSGVPAANASITAVGGQPWVAWRQRGGASAVGVAAWRDGAWEPVGTPYSAASGADIGYGPALTDVGGFPWYSFSQSDGTTPGGSSSEPCCGQVRVARIEPDFSATSAQPGADRATLLTHVEDYGLPFRFGFRYRPDGGTTRTTTPETAGSSVFYQSVSRLAPSSVYSFHPYAVDGSTAPSTGEESYFVTNAPDDLVMAIVRYPRRLARGQEARVRFITTEAGTASLEVRHDGAVVDRSAKAVTAGLRRMTWASHGPLGRYTMVLHFRSDSGQRALDRVVVRLVRPR